MKLIKVNAWHFAHPKEEWSIQHIQPMMAKGGTVVADPDRKAMWHVLDCRTGELLTVSEHNLKRDAFKALEKILEENRACIRDHHREHPRSRG